MKLSDVLDRAKSKSSKGRERRKHNFYNSPATSDKLIRLFGTTFKESSFGTPPPVTKKVRGMLSGFIKVCRSSHWPERRIYDTITKLVLHWDYIKSRDHHTLNNRKAVLGDRPSLLEFLICRETILSAIERAENQVIVEDIKEIKVIETVEGTRFTPTEEEMQEEYNRLMEDF